MTEPAVMAMRISRICHHGNPLNKISIAEIMQSMFGDGMPSGLARNEDAVPSAEEELTPQKEEASADNDDA